MRAVHARFESLRDEFFAFVDSLDAASDSVKAAFGGSPGDAATATPAAAAERAELDAALEDLEDAAEPVRGRLFGLSDELEAVEERVADVVEGRVHKRRDAHERVRLRWLGRPREGCRVHVACAQMTTLWLTTLARSLPSSM